MSDDLESGLARARERYSERYAIRAAVQAIPYVGGSIDTLIIGRYGDIQQRRVEEFVEQLHERLDRVEGITANLEDEAFADLIVSTFEAVSRSRSRLKRARFAAIIANQLGRGEPWEEPEAALRLLEELDDIHMEVLEVALRPLGAGVHMSPRVVDVVRPEDAANTGAHIHLPEALPQYSAQALRLACSELAARGLLVDFNADKWGGGVMTSFATTELAGWFREWLRSDP